MEIHPPLPVRHLSGVPGGVLGITEVRENSRLVIDLFTIFGKTPCPSGTYQAMISISLQGVVYLLAIDSSLDIANFRESEIRPIENRASQFSNMIVNENGRVTVLLDPEKLIPEVLSESIRSLAPVYHAEKTLMERSMTLLLVHLANKSYAVPLDKIRRILPYCPPARLHDEQEVFLGILDFEGRVIPVINSATVFDLPAVEDDVNHYVVMDCHGRDWAIPVQAADNLIDVPERQIDQTEGLQTSHVEAFCRHDGEIIPIVAVEKIYETLGA